MKKQTNLVPKRRFKEFQNAHGWDQRNWKETVDISTNMVDPKTGDYDELPHIGPGNIESFTGKILNNVLKVKDSNLMSGKFHFCKGDIIYGKINPQLGKYAIAPYEGLASADSYILNTKNGVVQNFLYSVLQTKDFYKYSVSVSSRTGMPKVNREELNVYTYKAPKIEEQTKIGNFFIELDHLIILHQRKLDKTKALKSAYLSEMFPAEGERVPNRRFAGFTQAWEQRKLETIAEFNPKEELPETFEYVDLESVAGTEMIAHREERKDTAPSRAQRLARQGDLFYQTVRPYQKNNYLFEKPCNNYVFSTGYAQLRPYGDGYFLLSLVQTEQFVKAVLDRCTGTSYPAINSNDLANMEVTVPLKKDEQIQIGKLFKSLDHLITLHQRKLEKLQNLKKAYLNEMFV